MQLISHVSSLETFAYIFTTRKLALPQTTDEGLVDVYDALP